ncbi:MAG TPA: hypothetical protein VGN18_16475 [Jatrophihabitans sp.]|jgi:hypothetical protein|uniref:hypothetical protein n=1 Tax=Jatrophihabitans sp. TaxID=1932789 RepID=UPI002E04F063|nr:hypothetical protein [Jatrophihabitans sp.]
MTWVLHGLHAGVIVAGFVAVLLLLRGSLTDSHRVADLRATAAAGRLVEEAERRASRLLHPRPPRPETALVVVSFAGLAAATVHAIVGPGHFSEGLRFGLFFAALTVVQVASSVQVLRRPGRPLVVAIALLDAGVVLVWLATRTVGLPFGLAEVEAVGPLDVIATAAELVALAAAARWLLAHREPHPIRIVLRSADLGR